MSMPSIVGGGPCGAGEVATLGWERTNGRVRLTYGVAALPVTECAPTPGERNAPNDEKVQGSGEGNPSIVATPPIQLQAGAMGAHPT